VAGPPTPSSPTNYPVTSKSSCRTLALAVFMATILVSPAVVATESGPIVTGTFTLQHRAASEAIDLIHPLLTARGAVELRPADNTLVIRDVSETVDRALVLLAEFDLPAPTLRFELRVVRAGLDRTDKANQVAEGLPPALVDRLRELLRYDSFELLSGTDLAAPENQQLEAWIGADFQIRFRVGVVQVDRRVKLYGFQVARREQDGEVKVLIHTNLSLWLDKPMILGLARTESSEQALMVVIHCTLEKPLNRARAMAGDRD